MREFWSIGCRYCCACAFFGVSSYAIANEDLLCAILNATEAQYVRQKVQETFSASFQNNFHEPVHLEATASEIRLTVGEGGNVKTFTLPERLSLAEFRRLSHRIGANLNAYGPTLSNNRESLVKDLQTAQLEQAFVENPKPITAARELVEMLQRTKQTGATPLKVELITDGVPTTWEQIQAWSKLAATMHEVMERRLLGQVSKELQRQRVEKAEQQRQEEGRRILEEILGRGEPIEQSMQPTVDFEALLDLPVRDPKAVVVKVSGFVDSVDYQRPLEIKLETYRDGLQISMTGHRGRIRTVADIAAYVNSWSKGHWRCHESLPTAQIPGTN